MGGPVRNGDEASGVSGWCEPNPPRVWRGYKVRRENAQCSAREEVPGQCFGLGVEVTAADGVRLTPRQCEERCCGDGSCALWQALEDRGCFMSRSDVWCDPTVRAYTGRRKCARGFCGGKEDAHEVIAYSGKVS